MVARAEAVVWTCSDQKLRRVHVPEDIFGPWNADEGDEGGHVRATLRNVDRPRNHPGP
jgi:hypothetical protein